MLLKWREGWFVRWLLAASLAICAINCTATELRMQVFTLFKPTHFVIRPEQPGVLNGQLIPAGITQVIDQPAQITGIDGRPFNFSLAIPKRIERRFSGKLEVNKDATGLTAIIVMDRETAVRAALSAEMPADSPPESLAAMAVVIRSYYTARPRHQAFDFCDTTHCQFAKSPDGTLSAAAQACERTRGITLHYGGEVIAPYYSAACGGRTKTLAEVALPAGDFPYRAVDCRVCRQQSSEWSRRLPARLAPELANGNSEAVRLRVTRALGWSMIPSNNYHVRVDGDDLVFEGSGSGHGVGVCQRGASGLAREGASWRDIIATYLPGVVIR